MSGLPDYGIKRDYPTLWEKGVQYDISQRLGGTDNKLLAEIDAALRELWDARRPADSQEDTKPCPTPRCKAKANDPWLKHSNGCMRYMDGKDDHP